MTLRVKDEINVPIALSAFRDKCDFDLDFANVNAGYIVLTVFAGMITGYVGC